MELLDGYKGETAEPADEKAARVLNHGEVTLGFSSELAREGQKIDGAAEAKEAKPEERKPEEAGALPAWNLEPASEAAAPESGGIAAAGDAGQAEGSAPSMAAAASETARELSPGVDDLDQMARKMDCLLYTSILLPSEKPGRAMADLWRANALLLTRRGVRPERISSAEICAICHNRDFFSHRKGDAGRQCAFLRLI